ncbi:MAG: corA [Mycobacterium sp.]|nr:corA [Mycobacterium sp.]
MLPTLLSGSYGMRFNHIPKLHWAWIHPICLIRIAPVCAYVYRRLHGHGWL